jgi:hypothetical protein
VAKVDVEAHSGQTPLGRASAWALAGSDGGELMEPRRNDAQLSRLAERFGGSLLAPRDVGRVIAEIAARPPSTAALVEQELWHTPWVLLALLALLIAEWLLRRRWGLR